MRMIEPSVNSLFCVYCNGDTCNDTTHEITIQAMVDAMYWLPGSMGDCKEIPRTELGRMVAAHGYATLMGKKHIEGIGEFDKRPKGSP